MAEKLCDVVGKARVQKSITQSRDSDDGCCTGMLARLVWAPTGLQAQCGAVADTRRAGNWNSFSSMVVSNVNVYDSYQRPCGRRVDAGRHRFREFDTLRTSGSLVYLKPSASDHAFPTAEREETDSICPAIDLQDLRHRAHWLTIHRCRRKQSRGNC